MSRFSATWRDDQGNPIVTKEIVWRQYPHSPNWYRLYWGAEELATILKHPGVTRSWDVIIQAGRDMPSNNQLMSDYSGMGQGFATRKAATDYVLKALGIWPKRN